jgi:hypothetical protein
MHQWLSPQAGALQRRSEIHARRVRCQYGNSFCGKVSKALRTGQGSWRSEQCARTEALVPGREHLSGLIEQGALWRSEQDGHDGAGLVAVKRAMQGVYGAEPWSFEKDMMVGAESPLLLRDET